jgi:hypothetical protein
VLPEARQDSLVRSFSTRSAGLVAAATLILVGLFLGWQSTQMAFGSFELPGPGFFPLILSVLLVGFAAVTGAELAYWRGIHDTVAFGHRDVLIAAASLLVVPALFESLGTYLTLGMFSAVLLTFVGGISILRAVAGSAIGMVAVWYFFKILLGLQLPNGPF